MILDDPALEGVACVLFDEFHERSLDADLGLALALDAQAGLRDDLRLVVMSATLDGARVAALMGEAETIESEGRAFPVETRYLGRDANERLEEAVDARGSARARRGGGLDPRVPAGAGGDRARRRAARGGAAADKTSRSRRCMARSIAPSRTAPFRPRRRGGARSCWRPRSPKPRSPSRACASSSIAGCRACRSSSPISGLSRLETVTRLARQRRSAAGQGGAHRAGRLLPPVGRGRRRIRSPPSPRRRFSPPICPAWRSISPIGA